MPTAAAVAAAAATAKIQAMEATLGSSTTTATSVNSTTPTTPLIEGATIPPPGLAIPSMTLAGASCLIPIKNTQVQPVLAANAPGIITGVTVNPPAQPQVIQIPPPTLVTNLPIPSTTLQTTPLANIPTITSSLSSSSLNFNETASNSAKTGLAAAQEQAAAIAAAKEKDLRESNSGEEPQTLQQQENMVIKGTSARQILMQKLMRKNEVIFDQYSSSFDIHS